MEFGIWGWIWDFWDGIWDFWDGIWDFRVEFGILGWNLGFLGWNLGFLGWNPSLKDGDGIPRGAVAVPDPWECPGPSWSVLG